MDIEEMVGKLRAGEPLYGKSEMDEYHQQLSASQSRYAQLKFRMLQFGVMLTYQTYFHL
jgi:hypothetical protein